MCGRYPRRSRAALHQRWPERGRQLQSRDEARGDWWLSATIIGILRAAVRLPAIVAHLHLRVRARSSPLVQHAYATAAWVCTCATQGSERCCARCRLDAVLRQLRSLAHARLPQAVRLLPGRGISAGRLASSRLALSRHARCSRVTSRRTASRGSARNRQGRASVVMLQAAAERDFCCGTPPRPPPPSSSRPSSSSPRSHALNLSSASGRSTCSRQRRSCASTRRCSTHVSSSSNTVHAARSKQHFSTLSLRPRAPRCSTQLAEHVCHKLPLSLRPKHLLRMRRGSRT